MYKVFVRFVPEYLIRAVLLCWLLNGRLSKSFGSQRIKIYRIGLRFSEKIQQTANPSHPNTTCHKKYSSTWDMNIYVPFLMSTNPHHHMNLNQMHKINMWLKETYWNIGRATNECWSQMRRYFTSNRHILVFYVRG